MKTYTATYASSLGPIVIESDGEAITSLRFCDEPENTVSTAQEKAGEEAFPREAATALPIIAETLRWLDDYFAGKRPCNVPRLNPQGTAFQKRVWQTLLTIPYGKTISYGEIAKMVDCRSAQAVGQAVGRNPIALIIPCHRVIAANGQLGGYAYGTEIKKRLLEQGATMITIQHQETEKNGVFEAWMRATEEGACTEPVQVGEMTYQRPTPQRMIIDHTRVFDGFEGRGIARQMVLAAVDFARLNSRFIVPVCSYARTLLTRTDEYKDILV